MAPEQDLNEQVEEVIDDATVITVPIDDTLSNSGEAADAKAVGDALALKADRSELQTAVTVNGQSADAQGRIIVDAGDIKMGDSLSDPTIKSAVETLQGQDANDIPMDKTVPSAGTVKDAINASKVASGIHMTSDPTSPTVAEEIADFTDSEINQMLVDAGYKEA